MLQPDSFMNDPYDGKSFKERRLFRRIPVNIDVSFSYSNMFYSGIITNLSETGMFINTRQSLPIGTILVVIIRRESELTKVFVKVKRMERSHNDYEGIAVKLISPSEVYSGLVKDFKTTG